MDKIVCSEILDVNQVVNMEEGNIICFINICICIFDEIFCWCKNDKILVFNLLVDKLFGEEIY